MIEGIFADVSSSELLETLKHRRAYHEQKVVFYQKKLELIRENEDESETTPAYSSGGAPGYAEQVKIREHRNKVTFFGFMIDHLIPDEVYRLDESDLYRIEILERS